MAWSSRNDNYWRAGVTLTKVSETDTSITLKYTALFSSDYRINVMSSITWNMATSGAYSWSSSSGGEAESRWIESENDASVTLGTKEFTVNKTTSSQTVNASNTVKVTSVSSGTQTASVSYTIPAKTSYKITFNANGGTGAPSSQTKWHGTTLTLSSTKPTRSGYTFLGWSTSSSATSASYSAGGSYTTNASVVLYAIWRASVTLTYNANGGSGAPSSVNGYIYNATTSKSFTVSSTTPARTGYTFLGWSTSSTATSASYNAGSSVSVSAGNTVTLYAVWDANLYTYNIIYKSSSGVQLGTSTISYDYGTTNIINPKSFTGYTSPSSQSVKWDSTSAKTITFTYSLISYNVTINCNGGSGISSRTYTIETTTFSLGTPSRTGYTFLGWTGSNGTTTQKTVSISKGSTGNKSYTAQWVEHKLIVNYYSNKANYGTLNNTLLNVSVDSNVLVHSEEYLYDNEYSNGLDDVQSVGHLYLSRTGYKPTGYWGTSTNGGTLISQNTQFATGQALAIALGKNIASGNASVDVYVQWKPSGVIYIDNGTTLDAYLPYIDNGVSWDLYLVYVDNGASWDVIS